MTTLLAIAMVLAQDGRRDEAEAKVRNLRVTLDFKETPLETVVEYLREISDLNIFVDAKVREKNIVVSLKVTEVSLKGAFGLMLGRHDCDTMFRDGVLQVMTKADIVDHTVRMQIYDCRDILYPISDFPGVDIDLGEAGKLIFNTPEPGEERVVPVEEMVRTHTGGRSWEENQKCVCRISNGLLVIKNTPEVHRQVVRLLDMLRSNK